MPLQLRATNLPLDRIDLNDETFSLTIPGTSAADSGLKASIAKNDILHPPIVQKKSASTYRVVAGKKRLSAISTTRTSCECLVLAENTGPAETLAAAYEETRITRQPTPLENAIFLNKGLRWLDEEQVAARFLPMLGINPDLRQLSRYLQLLELEEPMLLAVHAGSLDEAVARELGKLPFGDRIALFDLIDLLSLSFSNQKKLVAGCRELAKRNDTSIINILDDQKLREILANQATNYPQKTAHLMAWLTELRSPRLQEAEREFRSMRSKLNLPKGADLQHVQSFEKDALTLKLEFADQRQFEKIWPALREIIEISSAEKKD